MEPAVQSGWSGNKGFGTLTDSKHVQPRFRLGKTPDRCKKRVVAFHGINASDSSNHQRICRNSEPSTYLGARDRVGVEADQVETVGNDVGVTRAIPEGAVPVEPGVAIREDQIGPMR